MEEVSNPFGVSGRSEADTASLDARAEALDLQDKTVVDVNGQTLGKVRSSFAEEGALTRFDVRLSEQAKRQFGVTREVAGIPRDAIARVEGEEVRLLQAAEQLLKPDDAAPAHEEGDKRGAPELPRKKR